jgi:hypothetical protein
MINGLSQRVKQKLKKNFLLVNAYLYPASLCMVKNDFYLVYPCDVDNFSKDYIDKKLDCIIGGALCY